MSISHRVKPPHIVNNPVYSTIWTDIYEKDLDALIAICGRRGNCKSGSAIRFGEDFDLAVNGMSRFDASHVFFTAQDFINAIREKHPKGSVFVWDEVGVENDSRSWYSTKNKFIKYVMETNRYRNFVVLVTVPTLKSVDISTQRLLSGYIEMHGKIGDGNQAWGKFEFVETNPKTSKSYFKRPRYWDDDNFHMADKIIFPHPSPKLECEYKLKKEAYTQNLWANIESQLNFMAKTLGNKIEDLEKSRGKSFDEVKREIINNPISVFDTTKLKFVCALIRSEYGIGQLAAYNLAQVLNYQYKNGKIKVGV